MTDEVQSGSAGPASAGLRGLVFVLATLITLGSLAWALDAFTAAGLLLFPEQYLAGTLALALPLLFIVFAANGKKRTGNLPWYDAVLAAASFLALAFMAARYPTMVESLASRPTEGIVAAAVAIFSVMEGLRRTTGKILFVIVLVFFAYALTAHLIPGQFAGFYNSWDRLLYYMAWDAGSMFGLPMLVGTTVIIPFVLLGNVLFHSGGSGFFTDLAMAAMGRYRGGSAKIAVTASALFGSISGSAVSNVVSTGIITIPLMRAGGYPAHMAGAIEAVASTGGQLMPPLMGAAAFLMAEFLQVGYGEVVLAALVPAILYYFAVFLIADFEAGKMGIKAIPAERIPALGGVLKRGWFFVLPIAVLISALFFFNERPETAALWAIGSLIPFGAFLSYGGQKLTFGKFAAALKDTGIVVLDIVMITAAAGFIIAVLNITGLGPALADVLVNIAGGNTIMLHLMAAFICIVLGMGMPTAGVYVLVAVLVAPALIKAGDAPMAAHMYVMYFGMMSMITPPVAIAAFAAASLSGADAMKTGFAAMRFGWVAYIIPFMFVASPSLLLIGDDAFRIGLAIVTGFAGVWLISAAVVGYLFRRLGLAMRAGMALAGISLFIPAGAFHGAQYTDMAGGVLAVVLVAIEFLRRRDSRVAAE